MDVRVGDILAIRGTRLASDLICRMTGGDVSHVGLIIGDRPALVIEAFQRLVTRPLDVSLANAGAAFLIHPRFVDHKTADRVVREACRQSYWNICSFHVARAYSSIGFHFGQSVTVTPHQILAFARKRSNLFTITQLV